MNRCLKWSSFLIVAALLMTPVSVPAQAISGTEQVGRIIAYYAVIPAAIVGAHPSEHPEAQMHGGVPEGSNQRHLMVALFDGDESRRITDAKVRARVAELGLAGREKPLEPFSVSGAVTYGNYFKMAARTRYRITVTVSVPDLAKPVTFGFEYEQP